MEKWPQQPYNATYKRPGCLQIEAQLLIGDEDCLYMNIFKPLAAPNVKFPVLFWIHGGSYEVGSGNQFDVDGAVDNFASRGVVLVTINYRLGVLGFMSLWNTSLPGNYGLEDQLLALKWVNENIDEFSGDRKSISICGESAGAASVNLLALSPRAQGLFHRAIMISGAAIAPWAMATITTKRSTEELLYRMGCRGGWTTLQCLKHINVQEFFFAFDGSLLDGEKTDATEQMLSVGPVIDGYRRQNAILPYGPKELISKRSLRVPVLMGLTTGEMPSLNLINEKYLKNKPNQKLGEQKRQAYNDYMMNVPMCLMAKLLKLQGAPVYFYLYDLRNAKTNTLPYHGADVAFLFNNRSLIPNQPPIEDLPSPSWRVQSMIFDSFQNFIKTGNPSTPNKLPNCWPEYEAGGVSNVIWMKNDFIRKTDCFEDETRFWKSLDLAYAQF